MIVLRNKRYNPKIDFLVCKQLINSVTPNCDEDRFKDCFKGVRTPKLLHEKEIVKVKRFFQKQRLNMFTNEIVHRLYLLITNDVWDKNQGIFCPIYDMADVALLANLVKYANANDKPTLFKILLFWGYYKANKKILIPYKYLCTSIYENILHENVDVVAMLWEILLFKTAKCEHKHKVKDNAKAIAIVRENCSHFLSEFGAESLYVFGSLADGKGSPYSDIDLLAIFPNDMSLMGLKPLCSQYWQSKINIHVDISISNSQRFDNLSSPSIKKSLQKIGGTSYE